MEKKKKKKEEQLELKNRIANLPFYTIKFISDTYMEKCREYQRN